LNQKEKVDVLMKANVIVGLKRASWLFAVIVGLVTMIVVASDEGWDPEYWLPITIIASVIGFIVFRIAIWVFKGFAGVDKGDSGEEKPE